MESNSMRLRWNAKVLGFRLAEMYSTSNMLMSNAYNETNDSSDDAIYVVDSAMKTALSKDNKFMPLINVIQKEKVPRT